MSSTDAVNLAGKFAAVLRGRANASLLDTVLSIPSWVPDTWECPTRKAAVENSCVAWAFTFGL
jgi:hypothetical protein